MKVRRWPTQDRTTISVVPHDQRKRTGRLNTRVLLLWKPTPPRSLAFQLCRRALEHSNKIIGRLCRLGLREAAVNTNYPPYNQQGYQCPVLLGCAATKQKQNTARSHELNCLTSTNTRVPDGWRDGRYRYRLIVGTKQTKMGG